MAIPIQWAERPRTHGAYMTCMAMCRSGVSTFTVCTLQGSNSILAVRNMGTLECCVVVMWRPEPTGVGRRSRIMTRLKVRTS
jgi:hypothetical protein